MLPFSFPYFSNYTKSDVYSYQIFNLESCGTNITFHKDSKSILFPCSLRTPFIDSIYGCKIPWLLVKIKMVFRTLSLLLIFGSAHTGSFPDRYPPQIICYQSKIKF